MLRITDVGDRLANRGLANRGMNGEDSKFFGVFNEDEHPAACKS